MLNNEIFLNDGIVRKVEVTTLQKPDLLTLYDRDASHIINVGPKYRVSAKEVDYKPSAMGKKDDKNRMAQADLIIAKRK